MTGIVYLAGAGPGDPGLLTVKTASLLARADVVAVDALVSSAIRRLINPSARVINVGKRASLHTMPQDQINQLLVDEARKGNVVVRLKGGDPFVFGRGGEEAEELSQAGIRFEIVPGISSSVAGPAYAGIPVTHRDFATSVTLITGHESDGSRGIPWTELAAMNGTVVFMMGLGNLPDIAEKLMAAGRRGDTPVAIISKATTPEQKTLITTLENAASDLAASPLPTPALIVVGEVVSLRGKIEWFESRTLFGRTIAVTRARAQASDLVSMLEKEGARVIEFPTIAIEEPEDFSSIDAVVSAPETFHWLIFTSVNGVDSFMERLMAAGGDARALSSCRIAAVGKPTAELLRRWGLVADLVPEKFLSIALLPHFPERLDGIRIAIVRAEQGRDELREALQARGATVELAIALSLIHI